MSSSNIAPPDLRSTVTPVLSSLPGAAVSTEPPTTVLPALSPILRQRVQLLASASTEPWIRLLSYEPAKVPQLSSVAQNGTLDPHPVSGEIEVDWRYDVDTKYKRIDQETLQAMVVLKEFNLFFRLVYCIGDPDGGDGWRVGEVGVTDSSSCTSFGGASSISEAEKSFQEPKPTGNGLPVPNGNHAGSSNKSAWSAQTTAGDNDINDDDDDDYWARYDATPSRTPAAQRSPAPRSVAQTAKTGLQRNDAAEAEAEDAYFAQYDSVQPAMDNHDPDEEASLKEHAEHIQPLRPMDPAKLLQPTQINGGTTQPKDTSQASASPLAQPIPVKPDSPPRSSGSRASQGEESWVLTNPRRASSAGSTGSHTVARLEEAAEVAESRQQAEFGVKQHVSRSIRSLFLLSRASGIDREEFERMVRTELDVLGMVESDI